MEPYALKVRAGVGEPRAGGGWPPELREGLLARTSPSSAANPGTRGSWPEPCRPNRARRHCPCQPLNGPSVHLPGRTDGAISGAASCGGPWWGRAAGLGGAGDARLLPRGGRRSLSRPPAAGARGRPRPAPAAPTPAHKAAFVPASARLESRPGRRRGAPWRRAAPGPRGSLRRAPAGGPTRPCAPSLAEAPTAIPGRGSEARRPPRGRAARCPAPQLSVWSSPRGLLSRQGSRHLRLGGGYARG